MRQQIVQVIVVLGFAQDNCFVAYLISLLDTTPLTTN